MVSTGSKPHAVCLPFPSQGHVNPMMQLAKLLHSRGFHITFVNSEFNHRRLIRSRGVEAVKGLPNFQFETIPDGLPPSDADATQPVPLICDSTRRTCFTPFLELLSKLNSSPQVSPVICVVSDGIMNCGTKAAQVIGVPYVQLWTSSTISFMGYLQYKELVQTGIVPFKVRPDVVMGESDVLPTEFMEEIKGRGFITVGRMIELQANVRNILNGNQSHRLLGYCYTDSFVKVNVVLDETNYLLWRHQVLLTVRSHRLERLLNGTMPIPPEFTVNAEGTSVVNEAFEDYMEQDSALASWLLSTISAPLLPQFVGAETAAAVWNIVVQFFANKSTTTVMNLHYKLQSLRKGDDSMHVYLTRIKEVCDALASCGSPISQVEHVVSILKGLPREYQLFMDVITSSPETLSLDRVYSISTGSENSHEFKQQSSTVRGGRAGGRDFTGILATNARMQFKDDSSSSNYVNLDSVACTCCANKSGTNSVATRGAAAPSTNVTTTCAKWIMDSGATHHVTPDAAHINHPTDLNGPGNLVVGNGSSLSVQSVG
ncbi:7-deoxyloganetin glucosyltransferase [Hibiscus syriacus]|uniref:7-deoxyloganetin glucosyltransferase n=1 Tax=Hibiscus syriacus TaxID=106335 RepID=A0A6A2ZN86_HIBSY|nr:7-deoxyloganetin glucosyltransferase [Hibiscus syriacus]